MTIAQVFTAQVSATAGANEGPVADPVWLELKGQLEELVKRQVAVDGCEGLYCFGDPATGEGISFTLWRDEAAMKAAAAYQEEEIANAKNATPAVQVGAPKIYQLLASG
jgi:hypothetical protein